MRINKKQLVKAAGSIGKNLVASLLGAGLLTTMSMAADFTLKFQSSDNSGNPNYVIQQEWAERVKEITGGRISVEMLPVGSIVKHSETLEAVGAGIIDGHVTATSYFSGKDPAFGLLGNTVGAWGDPNEMLDFINNGGGRELYEELLAPYGVQFIGASATGLEAFVSKIPLNGVSDLKGLKLRAPEGLVQAVFSAAGATPVNLPGSEVYTSLDKGLIDAADYTVFSTNHQQGMHKIATHPVYPGFHSLPVIEISMTKRTWDRMPEDLQKLLTESVSEFAQNIVSALKKEDLKAVAEAEASGSVTIHNWNMVERNKFRNIARGQWKVFAEKSPNAKKVYQVLTKYLAENGML
ncbi:TRAP transporter substrate-binding protein [Motiliproteus sp. MSK22-1]|uniref:TRAP transporter substrate-binding protein n=1 Tax=Motiliproteus sp. MSK22-1 TaxID=1897630 RepID=UPI0009773DB6|nr:TRAP transporter substrate-binding protein [Motiliproteus sp. MSK22-1]OMH25810.1 C4-dicarboxylate ABC transporter substrate-binding protein [Motiliproteus sp. MSK22-1]